MVQYLGVCLPMSGHRFDPWSRKIPRATGQLNPRCTTTAVSTPEPTLSIQSSQHTEKPGHCGGRDPAQPERKKNLKKKVMLNVGDFLNDMRHIHHERKNQGNIWGGGAARQFTFKPPTLWGDFSIMAERPVPHQFPHHQQQFGFHP